MSVYVDNPPSSVVRQYLIDNSIFTLPSTAGDWPLYASYFPDGDNVEDNAAAIYDISPVLDGREMYDDGVIQHYGLSFTIRSLDYETGWQKALSVLSLLSEAAQVSLAFDNADYVLEAFKTISGIVFLGTEEGSNTRYIFELTYTVTMKQN